MSTTHQYFDLRHFVSTINETYVAAQVAQSVAWRMDILITSKARALLRDVRETGLRIGEAERYADTAAMLRDLNVGEEWFKQTGLDRGVIEEITRLTALRQPMHELAGELTAMNLDWQGRPRSYEIPELESVFRAPPNTKISSQVKARVELTSKALAEAYGVDEKILRERRLAAQKRQAEDRAENTMETADLAWWCYEQALRAEPTELEAMKRDYALVTQGLALEQGFPCLAKDTQVVLITAARGAADRSIQFAEGERSMTDTEFARILACAMKAQKDLDQVLRAGKFAEAI